MSSLPRPLLALRYEKWAQEYLKSLPPEHFAEDADRRATAAQRLLEDEQRQRQDLERRLAELQARSSKPPG